jgi:hypothetical protein
MANIASKSEGTPKPIPIPRPILLSTVNPLCLLEDIGAEVGAEVPFALTVSTPRIMRMNETSLLFIREQLVGRLYIAGLLKVLNFESRFEKQNIRFNGLLQVIWI